MIEKKRRIPVGDAAFFCARFSAGLSQSARFSAIIRGQNLHKMFSGEPASASRQITAAGYGLEPDSDSLRIHFKLRTQSCAKFRAAPNRGDLHA
jgi:hypothetical protein